MFKRVEEKVLGKRIFTNILAYYLSTRSLVDIRETHISILLKFELILFQPNQMYVGSWQLLTQLAGNYWIFFCQIKFT